MYDQALEVLKAVLRRSPGSRVARDAWANATIGRAHLYNHTNRHKEAAGEWARLAVEDPNVGLRPRHELFVIQSLLFAEDWKAAASREIPVGRVGTPDDIAAVAAFLCSEDAGYVSGQVIYVAGGPKA
jgi:NAD(P)-dependent dehydrogenase (short-subunit alcohol dehydrogenase family)